MGIPTPETPPTIDNAKYYHVTVFCYQDSSENEDCSQTFIATADDCFQGSLINNWLQGGNECGGGGELIFLTGTSAQKISSIKGPYDTYEECYEAHSG